MKRNADVLVQLLQSGEFPYHLLALIVLAENYPRFNPFLWMLRVRLQAELLD